MKKVLVQTTYLPEHIYLIQALFWMASRTYLNDDNQRYWMRGVRGYDLGNRVSLLGVKIPKEIQNYKKYVNLEIRHKLSKGTASEEEKQGFAELTGILKKLEKEGWHKLEARLAELFCLISDKKVRLYGDKYIKVVSEKQDDFCIFDKDEYERVGAVQIADDEIALKNFDLKNEKLCYENFEYRDLRVVTEDLFKVFPPENEKLEILSYSFTPKAFVVDKSVITGNKNLGGRPKVLSVEDIIKIVKHVIDHGGYDWLTEKLVKQHVYELKKVYNLEASNETVRSLLEVIKKTLRPAKK